MSAHNSATNIEALLFDFDGTLIDASEVICYCFNYALTSQGIEPLEAARIKSMIGTPLRKMFEPFTDQADLDDLVNQYRKAFSENSPGKSRLIPGIAEFFEQIDSQLKMGIVTSRSSKGARQILLEFGLLKHFSIVVGIEDVINGKPHPEGIHKALSSLGTAPDKSVFIGDTVFDILAGKSAGTLTIGVTTGYHSRVDLIEAGADEVVDRLTESEILAVPK